MMFIGCMGLLRSKEYFNGKDVKHETHQNEGTRVLPMKTHLRERWLLFSHVGAISPFKVVDSQSRRSRKRAKAHCIG